MIDCPFAVGRRLFQLRLTHRRVVHEQNLPLAVEPLAVLRDLREVRAIRQPSEARANRVQLRGFGRHARRCRARHDIFEAAQ
jgi:hypothetical protein